MLRKKHLDKNGFYLEAVYAFGGFSHYRCYHKSGWDWMTDGGMSPREQRKELRRESRIDCGCAVDTSVVKKHLTMGDESAVLRAMSMGF